LYQGVAGYGAVTLDLSVTNEWMLNECRPEEFSELKTMQLQPASGKRRRTSHRSALAHDWIAPSVLSFSHEQA
jgi:hypothetical protein